MNDAVNYRALREAAGLSREEVANRFGISVQAVGGWETGATTPKPSRLPILAEMYNVPIEKFLKVNQLSTQSTDKASNESVTDISHMDYSTALNKRGGPKMKLLDYLVSDVDRAKDDIHNLRQRVSALEEHIKEMWEKQSKSHPRTGRSAS